MTTVLKGIISIMLIILSGCATHVSLSEGFDRSVKAYNRMLRWHEIENAGMTYLEPTQQEVFLNQAEMLKKRGLSITDFRILSSRFVLESKSGDAIAEFDYYLLPSNRVKTTSYRQEWVYQEPSKRWIVKSRLPFFE